jgi:saxitoxin biosynthesis operon SxtJ-like protein
MKLNLKDEPKEWRKSTLLTALGLALITVLLRWRGVFADKVVFSVLAALSVVVLACLFQPRWFRGYHRISMRLGFAISQFIGYIALILFFIFILTPIGLVLRLLGKDVLQLKPRPGATTYWQPGKECSPMDRLF